MSARLATLTSEGRLRRVARRGGARGSPPCSTSVVWATTAASGSAANSFRQALKTACRGAEHSSVCTHTWRSQACTPLRGSLQQVAAGASAHFAARAAAVLGKQLRPEAVDPAAECRGRSRMHNPAASQSSCRIGRRGTAAPQPSRLACSTCSHGFPAPATRRAARPASRPPAAARFPAPCRLVVAAGQVDSILRQPRRIAPLSQMESKAAAAPTRRLGPQSRRQRCKGADRRGSPPAPAGAAGRETAHAGRQRPPPRRPAAA